MKSVSSSVLILILFVTIYILCISTYTFITAMGKINLMDMMGDNPQSIDGALRAKRENMDEKSHNISLLTDSDSWKYNITFNICCDENEYLNSKLECVKANFSSGYDLPDKIGLLSGMSVVDENMTHTIINQSRLDFAYNFRNYCQNEDTTVLNWPQDITHTYYISQKEGHILELSDDQKTVLSSTSTSSYCLNEMIGRENSRSFVALLCPCREKVCIQKCCQHGYYYNTIKNSCEQSDNIKPYKPTFYNNTILDRSNISYHLIYSVSICVHLHKLLNDEFSMMYIQKNGDLMMNVNGSKARDIGRKMYCLDVFSDGSNNSSNVNGFYCQDDIKRVVSVKEGILVSDDQNISYVKVVHTKSSDVYYGADLGYLIMMLCILFVTL